MKLENLYLTSSRSRWPLSAANVLLLLVASQPVFAELGGYADSVETDRVHMKATMKVTQKQAYAVHEIQTATKTVVREYVGPDGHVFGVAWQGPFMPDLSHLLGSYYGQYSDAIKAENRHYVGHRPVDIRQPRLVVQGGGHMLGHFGRAFVPDMLPEGVTSDAVR